MRDFRIEVQYQQSMAAVFTALVTELGAQRWLPEEVPARAAVLPRAGLRFGYRQGQRLYSGQVLECLRPVSVVIVEQYQGPAGSIIARQRWRIEALDQATRLRGMLRLETNRFARLQQRFWHAHFSSRIRRTCTRVQRMLAISARAAYSGVTGQNSGSNSIVSANTSTVSGRPIFR